jgi:crotonobetainyl-CoA:carnitine CoA-transferase CaiB-like acyl-CoA transferase
MGGAMMAGGVAAALFARERSGEGSIVDVSLMSVGAWAMALWLGTAMLTDAATPPLPTTAPMHIAVNPTIGSYKTADGRFITLMMLQPGRYFADLCGHVGLEHLLEDERFQTAEGIMTNAAEVGRHLAEVFAQRTFAEWVERLQTLEGPWSPAQDPLEVAADRQTEANGYILPVLDADGIERKLVANPVQFDERPPELTRGPQFAEHTDEILRELGKSEEQIIELKLEGACA